MQQNQNQKTKEADEKAKAEAAEKAKLAAEKAEADKKEADEKAKAEAAENETEEEGLKSIKDQTLFIKGFGAVKFKEGQVASDDQISALERKGVKVDQYFK